MKALVIPHPSYVGGDERQLRYTGVQVKFAFETISRVSRGDIYSYKGRDQLIQMIKMVRQETGMGLLEAKELVEFCVATVSLLRDHRLVGLVNPIERPEY